MHATDIIAYTNQGDIYHPHCVHDAFLSAPADWEEDVFRPVFASEINDHVTSSCGKCLGPIVEPDDSSDFLPGDSEGYRSEYRPQY